MLHEETRRCQAGHLRGSGFEVYQILALEVVEGSLVSPLTVAPPPSS